MPRAAAIASSRESSRNTWSASPETCAIDAGAMFGSERAEAISYARIAVSIPPDDVRKVGRIQCGRQRRLEIRSVTS
jgi:esterase/lipase superfamily enzyme